MTDTSFYLQWWMQDFLKGGLCYTNAREALVKFLEATPTFD